VVIKVAILLKQNRCPPFGAQGIEAEIPQDLHRQIRGIGAVERGGAFHTPVFCEAKNVHIGFGEDPLAVKKILNRLLIPNPSLDLFKNLAVLSQVLLNLPQMAANSLFFSGKLFRN
jgi:hypothetical protein